MSPDLPIYIDVDDVLAETGQALCRCVLQEFGKIIHFENLHDFDLTVSFGLEPNEMHHLLNVFHHPKYLLSLSPLCGAPETVRHWHAEGRTVHIVTGRPAWTRDITLEWLKIHHIPFDELLIVDKYGREQDIANALTLEDLSAKCYGLAVEDSLKMAEFLAVRMNILVYLLQRPWNRKGIPLAGVVSVDNWNVLGDLV